ncbi:MAG: hypothetical protein IPL39_23880 [Opitutaceae bacterium]|nr:hypothetical protein [Opitutaceae bacterium]
MAIAIKHSILVTDALYKKFAEPEGKESVEGISEKPAEVIEAMVEPFYGPLKSYMRSSAYRGSRDFLAAEKRSVSMLCTVAYFSLGQGILGAIGLLILVLGIK